MNKLDIIRAWKDEFFRKSLNNEDLTLLPAHPSGEILLSDEEMARVNGGLMISCEDCCTSRKQCGNVPPRGLMSRE